MAFVPRVHNRSTPMSNRSVGWEMQRKDYDKHQKALDKMSSQIDNKWTESKKASYSHLHTNPKKAQLREERNAEIELENYLLLSKLSNILERSHDPTMGAEVPAMDQLPSYTERGAAVEATSLNISVRQKLQDRIAKENGEFVRRLERCRPSINRSKMEEDAQRRERWLAGRAASKHTTAAVLLSGSRLASAASAARMRPQSAPVSARGSLTGGHSLGKQAGARAARPQALHSRRGAARAPARSPWLDEPVSRVLQLLSSQMAGASSLEQMRDARDSLMLNTYPLDPTIVVETLAAGSVEIEVVRAAGCDMGALLILVHGGMFMSGSPKGVRHLAARLSAELRVPVATPRLRLAPEHAHPAALDDLTAAYDHLAVHGANPAGGAPPGAAPRIALFGESSGCALALTAMLARMAGGKTVPSAVVFASPWLDLSCSGSSCTVNEAHDPVLQRDRLTSMARAYLGSASPSDPLVSPLLAPAAVFAGLPPMLLHVGDTEVLLDDSRALREKLLSAGVPTTYREFSSVLHAWHAFFPLMPRAEEALCEAVEFLMLHLAPPLLPTVAEEGPAALEALGTATTEPDATPVADADDAFSGLLGPLGVEALQPQPIVAEEGPAVLEALGTAATEPDATSAVDADDALSGLLGSPGVEAPQPPMVTEDGPAALEALLGTAATEPDASAAAAADDALSGLLGSLTVEAPQPPPM